MDDVNGIENIYYVSYLRGFSDKFIDDKIDWIIEFSGLENAINRNKNLFIWYESRLAVSILLSQDPKIIILDEFFGAGDKNFQDKVDRLEKIISKSGLVLFASHDEGLVNKISTKIIHMDKGKIIKIDNRINENRFSLEKTSINGVYKIRFKQLKDNRGYFQRLCFDLFKKLKLPAKIVNINNSLSKKRYS